MLGALQMALHAHCLTPDTRRALSEDIMDALITQSPEVIVQNTVQIFTNLRAGKPPLEDTLPLQMQILFRENLP